jgi:20S proteasome subunit alpha 6
LRDLVLHGLSALRKSASEEGEIKGSSVEIGVVGGDLPFRVLSVEEVEKYLKELEVWGKEG